MVYCVRLARALVDDYCCLVPGSVQTLKQIFSASPRFCCQFITSVTALYDLSSGKKVIQVVAIREASTDCQFYFPVNALAFFFPPEIYFFILGLKLKLWTAGPMSFLSIPLPELEWVEVANSPKSQDLESGEM